MAIHPVQLKLSAFEHEATRLLEVLSEFIGTNTLFVAYNDGYTNTILKALNRTEPLVTEGTSIQFLESYCSLVLNSSEEVLIIDDTQRDSRTSRMKITNSFGSCSFLGIPITSRANRTFGTLCAMDQRPYHYSDHEIALLKSIASMLGYIIDLENTVMFDPLTETYNRNYLTRYYDYWLAKDKRNLAILFVDVDEFKSINDTYGHDVGDLFLKEVAFRLKSSFRPNDIVARLGGDEFLVLLEGFVEEGEVGQLAEQALQNVRQPFVLEGHEFKASVSIGISFYREGADLNTLLRQADDAMYQAKRDGKGRIAYI